MKDDVTFYCILVCYYEIYLEKSLTTLVKLLPSGSERNIIVVKNNPNLKIPSKYKENIIEVVGTNRSWEFSGWDEGISYIKNTHGGNLPKGKYIFANDTFSMHRNFGYIERLLFSRAFAREHVKAVGAVDRFQAPLLLDDTGGFLDKWVSTYLFCLNEDVLNCIGTLDYVRAKDINIYIQNGTFKSDRLSNEFLNRLNCWLLSKSKNSWYKSGMLDKDLLINKAKAISNEKYISFRVLNANFDIIDVYDGIFLSKYYDISRKLYRVKRKFKKYINREEI